MVSVAFAFGATESEQATNTGVARIIPNVLRARYIRRISIEGRRPRSSDDFGPGARFVQPRIHHSGSVKSARTFGDEERQFAASGAASARAWPISGGNPEAAAWF